MVVEVVTAPGLIRGQRFTLTAAAVRAMARLDPAELGDIPGAS